jgi:hypothetical protein
VEAGRVPSLRIFGGGLGAQLNRASLVHGRLRSGDLDASLWHIDAVAGASTPSLRRLSV